MIEILKNTQAQLSVVFSGGDADSGVTVTIVDADGNPVVTGAPATHSGVAGSGAYVYSLAPQAAMTWLTVTWTGTFGGVVQSITTGAGQADGTPAEVQVAGDHLFTISELRNFADRVLFDPAKYPDQTLIDARSRTTQMFEQFCGVAFVPRYGRVTLDGAFSRSLWLPRVKVTKLRSVSLNGVALSQADLNQIAVYSYGRLDRLALWPPDVVGQNVVVGYEHGYSAPPQDIARVGMMLTRYDFTTNQLADRFISMSNELGVIRQAIPNEECPTGIPVIDATLRRYRQVKIGVNEAF